MTKPQVNTAVLDAVQDKINARAVLAKDGLEGFLQEHGRDLKGVPDEEKIGMINKATAMLFDSIEVNFEDLSDYAEAVADGLMLEVTDSLTEVVEAFARAANEPKGSPQASEHANDAIAKMVSLFKETLQIEWFTAFGFAIAVKEHLQEQEKEEASA